GWQPIIGSSLSASSRNNALYYLLKILYHDRYPLQCGNGENVADECLRPRAPRCPKSLYRRVERSCKNGCLGNRSSSSALFMGMGRWPLFTLVYYWSPHCSHHRGPR